MSARVSVAGDALYDAILFHGLSMTQCDAGAEAALEAADAWDADQGFYRVRIDDEGMKRALDAVDTFTELVYDSFAGKERDDLVRAIVAALREQA